MARTESRRRRRQHGALIFTALAVVVVTVATTAHPAGQRLIQKLAQFVRSRQRKSS